MSKIGEKIIPVPSSVTVSIEKDSVSMKGAKGELTVTIPRGITIEHLGDSLIVKRANDTKKVHALHGLIRSLV